MELGGAPDITVRKLQDWFLTMKEWKEIVRNLLMRSIASEFKFDRARLSNKRIGNSSLNAFGTIQD